MPNDGIHTKVKPPLSKLDKRYAKAMKKLDTKSGGGMKIPNKKAAIWMDSWVQKNFRSLGKFVGGWKPLKFGGRWIGRKPNRRFDTTAKVLQHTGRLRASFVPFATTKDAGIGSDLPYSRPHQKGEGRLPKRRMIPNRKEVLPAVVKIYRKYVKDKVIKKLEGDIE